MFEVYWAIGGWDVVQQECVQGGVLIGRTFTACGARDLLASESGRQRRFEPRWRWGDGELIVQTTSGTRVDPYLDELCQAEGGL